jgi:AcrR family transcriptional regulator
VPEISASTVRLPALIRNEPVQARSTARLAALLDAAAQVVDEIGYERLTTAMVADRAGASIGTVYRYFPDRIAVLQSLAARNEERISSLLLSEIRNGDYATWIDAMVGVFALYVEAFRTEPGFASLRLGDVLDLRPAEGTPQNSVLADRMFDALVARFGVEDTEAARFAFDAGYELTDALVARAFARDAQGDVRYLDQARSTLRGIAAKDFATTS